MARNTAARRNTAVAVSSVSDETLSEYLELRDLWRADPALYMRDRLGVNPTWQQEKILQEIAPPGAKVSVRAGHQLGKSLSAAAAGWWQLETCDLSKVPCTAPTQHQLETILWSAFAKLLRLSDERSAKFGLPRALWLSSLFNFSATSISEVGNPKEWFAVARTSRRERPDALQGFGAMDVVVSDDGRTMLTQGGDGKLLYIVEEASGVYDEIFEVAEGALASRGARMLLIGNPVRNRGYFHRSHTQDRALFSTLHFRSDESPIVDPKFRSNLVRKYGEGSNIVRVRADGEFPKQDDDVLISIEHAEAAVARRGVPGEGTKRLGVDVAEMGRDRTTLVLRQGRLVGPIEIHAKQETMMTVGNVVNFANTHGVEEIYVDGIGVGAGVASRLKELHDEGAIAARVIRVDVSRTAPPRKEGRDAQGWRLRDHLWIEAKFHLEHDEPSFEACDADHAADLAAELTVPTYGPHSGGTIRIEDKDSIKRRNEDRRSPDIAEGYLMTLYDEPPGFSWYVSED